MKTCAACGEQNPAKAKFCLECGAPLPDVAAADRRERRVISVLFADLVGFTSRSERLDVEDVEGFLSGYHRLLRQELERHGGTVEKFIGDAVMALFGAPVAHEDDGERAVRAALAIQRSVAALRGRDGVDVHVRVGVTTGEALVVLGADPRAGEGMASGDVVNTAARLQSASPVDGVLVDEATYRATERVIRYAPHEPILAKGKADPVPVWLACEPRSLVPEQARAEDLPLVGRDAEVSQLVSALDRSRREPSTQLVTLVGPPGLGKTRLVQELLAHVEDAPDLLRWRQGRSLAYGEGVAFWALGEMVKAQAGILESDSADEASAKLAEAVAAALTDTADRDWVLTHLRPLVGLDTAGGGEDRTVEAFAAWRRFLEALAEESPTVLVFEDVHWADEALLDFIDLLVERAGAVPLLVVCTARPEFLERRVGWAGGKTNAVTLSLAPLSDEDTARLVGVLLEQALLPAETQQALLTRAEGNPLYAQEYVRMLRDQGLLVRDAHGWQLVAEPEAVPDSLQAIIAARLDTLPGEERQLVQDAAVVGRTAWLGAVSSLAQASSWQADELLHRLERKQLVRRARRSSVAGEVEFSFTHALTQTVAYAQIPRAQRGERHERAAAWIEQLAAGRDDKAELLAHHYASALTLRRELGVDAADLIPRARTALAEAGRQALAVNAHTAAARHLQAALEVTPDDAPEHPRLLLDQASALYSTDQADEATLQTALEAQIEVEDWEGAALACRFLAGYVTRFTGDAARVHAILADGAEYAARCGYVPVASELAAFQAADQVVAGRFHEAMAFTQPWIARAQAAGDARGTALVLAWHGAALALSGRPHGVEEMQEAADALAAHGDRNTAVMYGNLGEALVAAGDLRRAATARRRGAHWAERFGLNVEQATCFLVDTDYHEGRWDAAFALVEPICAHPNLEAATYALWLRGRIVAARDATPTTLERDAARLISYAEDSDNVAARLEGLTLRAASRHLAGDADSTDSTCRELFDHWSQSGGSPDEAPTIAELALIPGQERRIGAAAQLLPASSRWKEALTAVAENDFPRAAHLYAEIGSAPLEAAAHLRAAERAAQDGSQADAAEPAYRALAFYRSVDASRYAARAESVLAAPAGTSAAAHLGRS